MADRDSFHQTDNAIVKEYGRILGAKGIAVYAVLNSYAGKNRSCYPSVGLISSLILVSERQISRELKKLEMLNIISVYRHKGRHNRYQLLSKKAWVPVMPARPVVEDDHEAEPWPDNVPRLVFPERPVTCEWGHDWGEEGNFSSCRYCGFSKAEQYYEQMGGYRLTPEDIVAIDAVNRRSHVIN